MKKYRWLLLAVNLLGGSAVIGSYIWGLAGRANAADILWGGVSESIRLYYTAGMLLAAAGYFAFTYFLLLRMDPAMVQVFGCCDARVYQLIYSGILVFSALWMPATFWAVDNPSTLSVWVVRGILILVAVFSMVLLAALLCTKPREPAWAHALAVIGAACFCIQTVILDAIVWGTAFTV